MKTKKFLLFALTALCSIGVWGTEVTAEWGYQTSNALPSGSSTVNQITLSSTNVSAGTSGWISSTIGTPVSYQMSATNMYLDIVPSAGVLKEVTISMMYMQSAESLSIHFCSETVFDQSKVQATESITGADGQGVEQTFSAHTAPDNAKSARITVPSDHWGRYVYYIKVKTEVNATSHSVSYAAGGAEGTAPAATDVYEQSEYTLANPSSLSLAAHMFMGWKSSDDNQVYAAGTKMTMGTADVTYTAQWAKGKIVAWGYQAANSLPSNTASKVNAIVLTSNFAITTDAWICVGNVPTLQMGDASKYIDITLDEDSVIQEVAVSVDYRNSAENAPLQIKFCSSAAYNDANVLSTANIPGGASTAATDYLTAPAGAKSARIVVPNDNWGRYLYFVQVKALSSNAPVAKVIPAVTNLNAVFEKGGVNLTWDNFNQLDLSKAVGYGGKSNINYADGCATVNYDKAANWDDNQGLEIGFSDMEKVTSFEFDMKGDVLNSDPASDGGLLPVIWDGHNNWWNKYVVSAADWTHVTITPNTGLWSSPTHAFGTYPCNDIVMMVNGPAAGNTSFQIKNLAINTEDGLTTMDGVKVIRKQGSAPASVEDGTEIYDGKKATATDMDVESSTTYYYAVFTYQNTSYSVATVTSITTGIVLQPAQLTFAADSKTVEVGASFTQAATAAAGYDGTISYSISEPTVASIDANTGAVTALAAGTAIVKAMATETANYMADTTTYTLTVEPPFTPLDIPGTLLPVNLYKMSSNASLNANDELLLDFNSAAAPSAWADFKVKAANAGTYTFTINGYNNNGTGHQITIEVFDANDQSLGVMAEDKAWGMPTQITVGSMEMEAGTYRLRISDPVEWAQFIVQNLTVTYKAPVVYDLPATLLAADAVLAGSEWSYDDGWIKRANVSPTSGSATWKANVNKAGEYKVSMNISSSNGFHLYVTAYDSLSQSVGQVDISSGSGEKELGSISFAQTGKYTIVVTNTTAWSQSWFKDLKFEFVPPTPSASFATTMQDIKVDEHFTQTVTTESTGAVTYESGNAAVATVDAATGEVTGVAVGTTSITANIAATADFRATSVSYTISVVAAPVEGRKYYIDPGSDKLYDVIQNAQENDTVIFRDGVYTEAYSRTFTTMITLMADEGAHPVINTVSYLKANKGITIDGVDINSTHSSYAIYLNGASTDDVVIRNATITCTGNYAVQTATSINRLMIDNCILSANYIVGISVAAVNTNLIKLTNSTLMDCNNYALYLPNANVAATVLVDHCTFYNIAQYAVDGYGFNSSNSTYSNCVFYNPTTKGTYGILAGSFGSNATVTNCLINNFSTATYHTNNTNLYTADPLLVVEDGHLYYQLGSPIVGAATDGSNLGDPRWEMKKVIISDQAEDNTVLASLLNKKANVQLERTLVADMFNTFCLPFALTAEQIAASDLAGARIISLTSTSLEAGKLYLNFEEVDAMEAGKGYMIEPAALVENPSFNDVTVTTTTAAAETIDMVTIHPTFIISQIPASPMNLYLYQNNTLYYPTSDLQIDGLRFYYEVQGSSQIPARMRIGARNTPTELIQVNSDNAARKVVIDGNLFIIKDGVMYNAQGQIVK